MQNFSIKNLFLFAWSVLVLANNFLFKHKRKLIQFVSMLVYNCNVSKWFLGSITKSPLKHVCVPGLNCYSCPAAISSCPLGSLQTMIASGRIPFFVTGFLLITGTLLGRMVCAFLCPVGFAQELLYKIKTPKVKNTPTVLSLKRKFSLLKYVLLIVFCVALPFAYFLKDSISYPFFCKFICPAGTTQAGIPLFIFNEQIRSSANVLFIWKITVAFLFLVWSVFCFRPFCTFFCPLGAIYSLFNKVAICGIHVDTKKCTNCKACTATCKMNAQKVNGRECIRCKECISKCKNGALH